MMGMIDKALRIVKRYLKNPHKKHRWEFYQSRVSDTAMVYICKVCGEVIPCARTLSVKHFSHLRAFRNDKGWIFKTITEWLSMDKKLT